MNPFARRLAGLAGTALMVVATIGFSTAQASAQEAAGSDEIGIQSSCDHAWSDKSGITGATNSDGVNIRSGPHHYSPACTIVGQAQASQQLRYDCWTWGTDGYWTHVYNYATGVQGWIKDDYLTNTSYVVYC